MSKKLIIFDCFGVIFEDIAPAFLKRYLDDEKALKIKDELFSPADLGKISYEQLLDNLAKCLMLDKEKMLTEWNSMLRPRLSIIPTVEALGEKYDVILLSNAPSDLVEEAFEEHNLTRLFKRLFISYKLGLAKPDKEIYLHCVREMDTDYDEIYMVDDNIVNLKKLHEIGINAIHYQGDDSVFDFLL